jgi:cyclophilin family peptidyl-prolyl cis-trans isomerase
MRSNVLRLLIGILTSLAVPAWLGAEDLVVLDTDLGSITIKLLADKAPKHVESFKRLVLSGFYDGKTFHRVIPGYIIQGGSPTSRDADPKNDNFGAPDFSLKPEFNDVAHDRAVVSMARSVDNPDSAGSQFFIVLARAPQLDQIKFTAFGRVMSGMEVADKIAAAPRDVENNDRPLEPVVVKRARVVGSDAAAHGSGGATAAAAGGTAARVRTTQDFVNVREGPATSRAVVQKVKKGTVLAVRSREGEWLAVELSGGAVGYVRQDMIEPAP